MLNGEVFLLTNFDRFLLLIFLLIAVVKIIIMSRRGAWDGWSLLALSLSLLSLSTLVYIIQQFGLRLPDIRPAVTAGAGLLAAFAFVASMRLIKKAGGKK